MNISPQTRAAIIKEHRSATAKKAAATLKKRYGKNYFKKQGSNGGLKAKRNRRSQLSTQQSQ